MQIQEIPTLSIPGISGTLYSVSYSAPSPDSCGTIEAEYLMSSGTSGNIENGDDTYFAANIGGHLLGHFSIISNEFSETSKYSTLKVKLADWSLELDRHFIALRGQCGYDALALNAIPIWERSNCVFTSYPSSPYVAWIGESDTNCVQTSIDMVDPCDPNSASDPDYNSTRHRIDCSSYYLEKKRVYQYSITQFVNACASLGISISGLSGASNLKFDYSGTVREVLNNICADLGMTFYYHANKVVVVDINAGISVAFPSFADCTVLEKSTRITREGARTSFGSAIYSREGEERPYSVGLRSCRKVFLNCLTLEDLLTAGGNHFDTFSNLEIYSCLSGRISKEFRDLCVWVKYLGIKDSEILESKIGTPLTALNGMTIKKVFKEDSADSTCKAIFDLISLPIEDTAERSKYCYFLAEVNEEVEKKNNILETTLCNDFYGKFWLRRFSESWRNLSYNWLSPDSVNFYDHGNPINLPFADIVGRDSNLNNCELLRKEARSSFLLMQRSGSYDISLSDSSRERMGSIVKENYYCEIATSEKIDTKLSSIEGLNYYRDPRFKLYRIVRKDNSGIDLAKHSDKNASEDLNVNLNIDACFSQNAHYGLTSSGCQKIAVSFQGGTLGIYMPVQGSVDDSGSPYGIFVDRSGGPDSTIKVPKIEVFSTSAPPTNEKSMSISFNAYNTTLSDISLLKGTRNPDGKTACQISGDEVMGLLTPLSTSLAYQCGETTEYNFSLLGMPSFGSTPDTGLRSLSISVGSSGVRCNLSYSNKHPLPKKPENIIRKLKYTRIAQYAAMFPMGSQSSPSLV